MACLSMIDTKQAMLWRLVGSMYCHVLVDRFQFIAINLQDTTCRVTNIVLVCVLLQGDETDQIHIFYRQLGCLAFSLKFWQKIKQFLSNCPASD